MRRKVERFADGTMSQSRAGGARRRPAASSRSEYAPHSVVRAGQPRGAPAVAAWSGCAPTSSWSGRRGAPGLSDFGDASFREPLDVLLRAYEREARLTFAGRIAARAEHAQAARAAPLVRGVPQAPSRDRRAGDRAAALHHQPVARRNDAAAPSAGAGSGQSDAALVGADASHPAARTRHLRDRRAHRPGRA